MSHLIQSVKNRCSVRCDSSESCDRYKHFSCFSVSNTNISISNVLTFCTNEHILLFFIFAVLGISWYTLLVQRTFSFYPIVQLLHISAQILFVYLQWLSLLRYLIMQQLQWCDWTNITIVVTVSSVWYHWASDKNRWAWSHSARHFKANRPTMWEDKASFHDSRNFNWSHSTNWNQNILTQ